jgi:hypothetical protein
VTRVSVSSTIFVYTAHHQNSTSLLGDRMIYLYPRHAELAQMALDMAGVSNLQFLPIYPSVVPKMDVISLFRLKADDGDHERGAV